MDLFAGSRFETKSMDEVISRIQTFQKKNLKFIVGNGWDQNDWEVKNFLLQF
jgi:hypothetical protein